MREHLILLLVFFLIVGGTVSAEENIFYNGGMKIETQKIHYLPGESFEGSAILFNEENFPLISAYLIVVLQEGCEKPTYPTQFSDCDNIFLEDKIENINLGANSQKRIDFSYKLPENLKQGVYRADFYFKTNRTPIVGLPFILSGSNYVSFTIDGSAQFPSVKILRTKTYFKGVERELGVWKNDSEYPKWPWSAGPVGIPVESQIIGNVSIQNEISTATDNLELLVSVYGWDDTSSELISSKKYNFSLNPSEQKIIPVELNAPEKAGAYTIRLEVLQDNQKLSVYKTRVIVIGETARIRKLYVNKPYFKENDALQINMLVGTSPDHYTKPTMKDLTASVEVIDLSTGALVLRSSKKISELSSENKLILVNFTKKLKKQLSNFKVTGKIVSSKKEVYDVYEIVVNSENFVSGVDNITVALENYDSETRNLTIKICTFNKDQIPVSTEIQAILRDDLNIIKNQKLSCSPCTYLNFIAEKQNYTLFVSANKQQFNFPISVPENSISTNDKESSSLIWGLIGGAAIIVLISLFLLWRGKK